MSSLVDESIISDFVIESREHLNAIEPDLLAMEQDGSSAGQEVLNRVFRAIHSIKGGAGFLAFENLKRLSHAMENILMLIRDGKMGAAPDVMDALLGSLDRLRAMLDDIQASDQVPCEQELGKLRTILEGQGHTVGAQITVQAQPEDPLSRGFDLDENAVRSAIGRGMQLYHARAYLHRDIKDKGLTPLAFLNNAMSVGNCLDAFIDIAAVAELDACLEQDIPVALLFASVLERDLAILALKLPEDQVLPLDMSALKERLGLAKAPPALPGAEGVAPPAEEAAPPEGGKSGSSSAKDSGGQETLRVRVDLLTGLMNQVGELVLGRNQLLRALSGHHRDIPGLSAILQNINQVTSELQEGIMQTRMQPIGTVFNRFPRIVRDMSKNLGKQIEVHITGAEVELDKSIVELLVDPLTHIIRNCADHAFESPAERQQSKKNPTGQLLLHAYHQGGQVIIAITDDGRGIDPKKVLSKAIARGLIKESQAKEMSDREIISLVFAPGFSTAEQVSDISGRGVGMDVVRSNTEKLGGHVELESHVGIGTTVLLRLPLTLAIIPSMIVGVSGHRFAIPQVNVVEFVWVRAAEVGSRIEQIHGAEVLKLRSQLLPLVHLADILGMERLYQEPASGELRRDRRQNLADRRKDPLSSPPREEENTPTRSQDRRQSWRSDYNIVVLRLGSNLFGVVVDELYDFEEIVVKPLSEFIQMCKCFSGATIMGDGRVIMILDAGGLVTQAQLHFADLQAEELKRHEEEKRKAAMAASRRRSVIVCTGAKGEFFAIPQDQILRLEKILSTDIQRIGSREFVNYRNHGLPLLRLEQIISVKPVSSDLQELFLIIPKSPNKEGDLQAKAGIVISDIIDAIDVEVELEEVNVAGPGVLGSAILQHNLTIFLEPQEILKSADLTAGGNA